MVPVLRRMEASEDVGIIEFDCTLDDMNHLRSRPATKLSHLQTERGAIDMDFRDDCRLFTARRV